MQLCSQDCFGILMFFCITTLCGSILFLRVVAMHYLKCLECYVDVIAMLF